MCMATFAGIQMSSSVVIMIRVLISLIVTILAHKIVIKLINTALLRKHHKSKIKNTQFTVMKHLVSAIIYIVGIATAISFIPALETVAVSLFAGAGVIAVVLGFAAQQAFSNIIHGIFIAMYKPFRVDDMIKFNNNLGIVEDITLRHTVIRNFENKRYVVPNSVLGNQTIENYHIKDEKTCEHIEFGISYDSDIDKAIRIIREEVERHPDNIDVRTKKEKEGGEPRILIKVTGFGESSIDIKAWAWANDPSKAYLMGCDVRKSIKERFDKEGVEIPYPYRTVVYKKDM